MQVRQWQTQMTTLANKHNTYHWISSKLAAHMYRDDNVSTGAADYDPWHDVPAVTSNRRSRVKVRLCAPESAQRQLSATGRGTAKAVPQPIEGGLVQSVCSGPVVAVCSDAIAPCASFVDGIQCGKV